MDIFEPELNYAIIYIHFSLLIDLLIDTNFVVCWCGGQYITKTDLFKTMKILDSCST